jgi:hypothetical protein
MNDAFETLKDGIYNQMACNPEALVEAFCRMTDGQIQRFANAASEKKIAVAIEHALHAAELDFMVGED